jgi:peptide deformylase
LCDDGFFCGEAGVAVLEIRQYPDPSLRRQVKTVESINGNLQRLIDDMFETLYAAPGLGLAAPQVGESLRLFVYDLSVAEEGKSRSPLVLINPEFVSKEGEASEEEGCLSVPEYRESVRRAARVAVRGLDRDGKEITVEGEGLLAKLLQHEIDHLDGKLFIDRISSLKRNIFLRRLKKMMKAREKEG